MEMLSNLFPRVVNLSTVASIAIVFVLIARMFLRKAPKIFSYALWGIVLVRLLIPVHIPSPVSVVPEVQQISRYEINAVLPQIEFETVTDRKENLQNLEQSVQSGESYVPVRHEIPPAMYLGCIWVAGVAAMTLYSFVSYGKIRKKVEISLLLRENIYLADDIGSPFVIGLIRPRIYLPGNLEEEEQAYIILHEQHHIHRCDHWIKALAFLALTIHWFNPLVWVAFILSARDMEMSCDEAVIRKAGASVRAAYSASLLTLATGRRIIAGTPLAFGEGDTGGRIRNLAGWRKPALWVIVVALVLCMVLAVCLLTNPIEQNGTAEGITWYFGTVQDAAMAKVNESDREGRSYVTIRCSDGEDRLFWLSQGCTLPAEDFLNAYVMVRATREPTTNLPIVTTIEITQPELQKSLDDAMRKSILAHHAGKYYPGQCQTANFKRLAQENEESPEGRKMICYGIVYYQEYELYNGILKGVSGAVVPTVLTFLVDEDNQVTLTEYWEPRDGSYYADDLKAKFRGKPWPSTVTYMAEQELDCYLQAMNHFGVGKDTVIHSILQDIVDRARWFSEFDSLIESCSTQRIMLEALGTDTLQYCFSRFLEGGQEDLYGQVMAYVCSEIMESMGEKPLEGWSFQKSGQDWFRDFDARAKRLAAESSGTSFDLERIYPGSWLYLNITGDLTDTTDWGLSLAAENVTPTGLTLCFTQSGGNPPGDLSSGSPFVIQVYQDGGWTALEQKPLENYVWTQEAWLLPREGTISWNHNWSWIYGELPSGQYRIGKSIDCFRTDGKIQRQTYFAEFTIP